MKLWLLWIMLLQTPTPILDGLLKEIASLRTQTPIGASVVVPAGANLQAAVDAAKPGVTLLLTPGATYPVNLVLRNKVGTATTTIRTAGLDDTVLPPNVRVDPIAHAGTVAKMAKLVCLDCFKATLSAEAGAHDYTLIGLEFLGNVPHPDRDVIQFGVSPTTGQWVTSYADAPTNVTLDRLYVHASDVTGGHRGILLDGTNLKLLNSDVRGFWEVGRDSQAVAVLQAKGPLLIQNNYLEGSGENFIVGGSDPVIQNATPADITFRGNYVFKPLAWKLKPGSVKNLFELKNAARVLVENNVFENNWVDGQAGSAILFTIRNQNGACAWCVVTDVLFQNNVVINGGSFAFNVLGTDNNFVSGTAKNLRILNNVIIGNTRGVQLLVPVDTFELAHNTFVGVTTSFVALSAAKLPLVPATGTIIRDNVTSGGSYGVNGDATGVGTPSLIVFLTNFVFVGNVIEGTVERTIVYPPTNTTLAPGTLAALLVKGRYLGGEIGSDGTRPGADVDAIQKLIPWWVP